MQVEETLGPDDLDRPDWNTLLENYSKHDIGEAYFVGRMEEIGFHVEHWGIDRRHQDENLIFDNKMDLKLWEEIRWPHSPRVRKQISGNRFRLAALVDVKTKANEDWMGKFNLRHLAHYAMHAEHYHAPAFVYMTMVDVDAQSVGRSNIIAPIPSEWGWEELVEHYDHDSSTTLSYGTIKDIARECPLVERTFRAPDGNLVIEMNGDEHIGFPTFKEVTLTA